MNDSCQLQAVVVSTDSSAVESISLCLGHLGITAVLHREISAPIEMFRRQKTDAFFVDHELDPEFTVLKGMRSSPSSRAAVAFAIVPKVGPANPAYRVADFVLDKPLAGPRLSRALRATYGIMLKERMRYFRHSLEAESTLIDSMQRRFRARISNISKSGVALETAAPLIAREVVQLEFCLPGEERRLGCKAQIIWKADNGKAGLTFTQFSYGDRARLTEWIESKFLREWQPLVSMGSTLRLTGATV